MAHLKATPRNFAAALQVLNGKSERKLGNNTSLRVVQECNGKPVVIAVRLHSTDIVKFFEDGSVTLHSGGYRTVTTKERLNQFISARVYQKNFDWYVVGHSSDGSLDWENPAEFTEGFTIQA